MPDQALTSNQAGIAFLVLLGIFLIFVGGLMVASRAYPKEAAEPNKELTSGAEVLGPTAAAFVNLRQAMAGLGNAIGASVMPASAPKSVDRPDTSIDTTTDTSINTALDTAAAMPLIVKVCIEGRALSGNELVKLLQVMPRNRNQVLGLVKEARESYVPEPPKSPEPPDPSISPSVDVKGL